MSGPSGFGGTRQVVIFGILRQSDIARTVPHQGVVDDPREGNEKGRIPKRRPPAKLLSNPAADYPHHQHRRTRRHTDDPERLTTLTPRPPLRQQADARTPTGRVNKTVDTPQDS